MAKKTTKGYKRERGLTLEQHNAIDLLVQGKTDQETADAVRVNRVTVTKWRNYDPTFQAELNKRRRELWGTGVDRLRSLLPKALDAIERELNDGESPGRVALDLLKLTGLGRDNKTPLGDYLIGPTDPIAVIDAGVRHLRPDPLDMYHPVGEGERRMLVEEWARRFTEEELAYIIPDEVEEG